MSRRAYNQFCTVYTQNGRHFVLTPSGEQLSVSKTIVTDNVDEIAEVTITMPCNLAPDYDAAVKIYEQ